MLYKKSSQKGVTLIELLISIAVIGIAIISIYLALIYGIKVSQKAKYLSLSYQIANTEIETIRNTPFSNLINQTNGAMLSNSTANLAKLKNGQGTLTISDYNSDSKIKEITVKITWTENNATKTTQISTLATEGGI